MRRDLRGRSANTLNWHQQQQAKAAQERVAAMYALYQETKSLYIVAETFNVKATRARTLLRSHGYEV